MKHFWEIHRTFLLYNEILFYKQRIYRKDKNADRKETFLPLEEAVLETEIKENEQCWEFRKKKRKQAMVKIYKKKKERNGDNLRKDKKTK